MQKKKLSTQTLVTVALLISLNIVIVRFLSIQTPIVRIGFGFIPTALCSMLFGPYIGALSAFLADFLGMVVNSRGMAYFPGFGVSELLYGLTYGWFLFRREKNYKNILLCLVTQMIFIDLGLGTLWIRILTGNPLEVVLSGRAIYAAIMFPIKIIAIKYIWDYAGKYFAKKLSY